MTLDQQLTEIISAARRQIMALFDERMNSLAGEIGQAASSDRTAAIREVRLAAEAEIVKRSQEAVVATQVESARRIQEAVAAAQASAAARTQEAVAAVQADAARRLDEAVAAARAEVASTARAELSRHVADAEAAARAEADQRIAAAVAAATRDAEDSARQIASQSVIDSAAAARQAELAQLDRIVDAIRRFDQARSLTDVLDALGDVTSREAPRVALFLVRGGRLAGWRASGFGPAIDPRAIEVASDESSLLWRAIASGLALSTTDAPSGDRWTTPFGQLGHDAAGLAVPVRVGGETVAVIYADDATDGPRAVPSAWPEVIEVLARHAARCLEVLTMSRAAPQTAAIPPKPPSPRTAAPERVAVAPRAEDDESARRYARLLVSEIKLYHEAAVIEGRLEHNLVERLGSEIERARKLYEERVPIEIRSRADHFGQELVRTLANGDPALLGASLT